jgi:hypothetical protein
MLVVFKFFSDGDASYKMAKFRAEWNELTDEEKAQLKTGVVDGSFNY